MTTSLSQDRLAQIKDIVCEHLELDPETVSEHTHFIEDHGADSLALMDVLAALEKTFGIEIDRERFERMVDLDSVCQVVGETAGW